jgi:hypothetical protein
MSKESDRKAQVAKQRIAGQAGQSTSGLLGGALPRRSAKASQRPEISNRPTRVIVKVFAALAATLGGVCCAYLSFFAGLTKGSNLPNLFITFIFGGLLGAAAVAVIVGMLSSRGFTIIAMLCFLLGFIGSVVFALIYFDHHGLIGRNVGTSDRTMTCTAKAVTSSARPR